MKNRMKQINIDRDRQIEIDRCDMKWIKKVDKNLIEQMCKYIDRYELFFFFSRK